MHNRGEMKVFHKDQEVRLAVRHQVEDLLQDKVAHQEEDHLQDKVDLHQDTEALHQVVHHQDIQVIEDHHLAKEDLQEQDHKGHQWEDLLNKARVTYLEMLLIL